MLLFKTEVKVLPFWLMFVSGNISRWENTDNIFGAIMKRGFHNPNKHVSKCMRYNGVLTHPRLL
jgi:hypothetical protein